MVLAVIGSSHCAALAGQLGRSTGLKMVIARCIVGENTSVRMGVNINEAGGDDLSCSIDDLFGITFNVGCDLGDKAVLNGNIGMETRRTASVDYTAVFDD